MTIQEQVVQVVSEVMCYEAKPESLLINDVGCDSLDLAELIMEIEEHFEVELPLAQTDFDNMTVADLAKHVIDAGAV